MNGMWKFYGVKGSWGSSSANGCVLGDVGIQAFGNLKVYFNQLNIKN